MDSALLSRAWIGTVVASGAILLCGLASGVLTARLLEPQGRGALGAVLFWPHLRRFLQLQDVDRKAIGLRGRAFAAERFSWIKLAAEMRAVYEWVLRRRGPPDCVTLA